VAVNDVPLKNLPFRFVFDVLMCNKIWWSVGGLPEDLDWYFSQERADGVLRLCYTASRFLPGPSQREFEIVECLPASLWDFDVRPRTLTLRVVNPHEED
jgi:hypothetical protein